MTISITGINVAIHESADSERVIETKDLSTFTPEFRAEHENGNIWGVYVDNGGEIVATTKNGETMTEIMGK